MKLRFTIANTLSVAAVVCWAKPQVSSEALQNDMNIEKLMNNLDDLYDIALANGGNRAFGFPGYAASVDYVWDRISKHNDSKIWKQEFVSPFAYIASNTLEVGGKGVESYTLVYSPSTSKEGITAEMVAGPEGGHGCDATSYEGLDVQGKIIVTKRHTCPDGSSFGGLVLPAAASGAAAVIIYNDSNANITGGTMTKDERDDYVPAALISKAEGDSLKARLDSGEKLTAFFQHTQILDNRTTQNVFMETGEGDEENVVVLGAHLDSVPGGPGINDDGSGSGLLLELADAITKYSFTNKIRFAWWAAEENGLAGSTNYCSKLKPAEVNNILGYLNFDMVSRGYYGVGKTNAESFAPAGSEAIEKLFLDHYANAGLDSFSEPIANNSDFASFWILNKPFGVLTTGTDLDPCYHQACDTIENPNPEVYHNNAKAAAHALATLAIDGTQLIPKTKVDHEVLASVQKRHVNGGSRHMMAHLANDKHVGCGLHF